MQGLSSLKKAFLVTAFVLLVQIVGYLLSGSLALLSDSGHVFSDLLAITASLIALSLASLSPSNRQTFGFHRMEVLAAAFNGILLLIMATLIVNEAFERMGTSYEIESISLISTAVLGLLGNLYVVYLLHTHSNLNIRSAFLHAMGDALSSVGVILSGIIIYFTGMVEIDLYVSIGIAFLILISAYRVLRKATAMLLDRVPKHLNTAVVKEKLEEIPGVKSVHDIHIWKACSDLTFATVHVVTSSKKPIRGRVEGVLKKMNINHTTIQIEKEIEECSEREGCSIIKSH